MFKSQSDIRNFLVSFSLGNHNGQGKLFDFDEKKHTEIKKISIGGKEYLKFVNEYWTSGQRQANSLHEVSYRACFKPQLPRFFIELFSKEGDIVYDPFSGRGTTAIEAALLGRNIIANDINPLSAILSESRLHVPDIGELRERLGEIPIDMGKKAEIDLSMFYHPETEAEIVSLRDYLHQRKISKKEDGLDKWIRMVATNRLTGHSAGFFSVYTLPPNQAVSPDRQAKINEQRKQKPGYRNVAGLIMKKTKNLSKDVGKYPKLLLENAAKKAKFLNSEANDTKGIKDESVQLTVTSPPFLDIVQYASDNWLRCWFNGIDIKEVEKKITMSKKINDWSKAMNGVFKELCRITKHGGWVAFEVGEIRNGKIKLDEYVVPLGEKNGFKCYGILVNKQTFTKTANIWGVRNNGGGTNTNRIVIFHKQ